MSPDDIARLVAFEHNARQAFALLAGLGVLIIVCVLNTRVDWCERCDHCRYEDQRKRDEQQRLQDEFAARIGLRDPENAPRSPRQPGEREGDVPGVVVSDGPADPAARPVEIEAEDDPGDAPSP